MYRVPLIVRGKSLILIGNTIRILMPVPRLRPDISRRTLKWNLDFESYGVQRSRNVLPSPSGRLCVRSVLVFTAAKFPTFARRVPGSGRSENGHEVLSRVFLRPVAGEKRGKEKKSPRYFPTTTAHTYGYGTTCFMHLQAVY